VYKKLKKVKVTTTMAMREGVKTGISAFRGVDCLDYTYGTYVEGSTASRPGVAPHCKHQERRVAIKAPRMKFGGMSDAVQ
jgi:hypothetical protein